MSTEHQSDEIAPLPMPRNRTPRFAYDPADTVVVVSGLPRSGTSMMMRVLEAGGIAPCTDRERLPDESNPKGYYELEKVKTLAKDNTWLDKARGKCVKVVAMLLPHLKPGLRYKVVFLWRDLHEVLRSQAAMLQRSGHEAGPDTAAMAESFNLQLQNITRSLTHTDAIDVLYIDYAQAVRDPESIAQQLHHFLGDAFDPTAAAAAVDATLYRQRRGEA